MKNFNRINKVYTIISKKLSSIKYLITLFVLITTITSIYSETQNKGWTQITAEIVDSNFSTYYTSLDEIYLKDYIATSSNESYQGIYDFTLNKQYPFNFSDISIKMSRGSSSYTICTAGTIINSQFQCDFTIPDNNHYLESKFSICTNDYNCGTLKTDKIYTNEFSKIITAGFLTSTQFSFPTSPNPYYISPPTPINNMKTGKANIEFKMDLNAISATSCYLNINENTYQMTLNAGICNITLNNLTTNQYNFNISYNSSSGTISYLENREFKYYSKTSSNNVPTFSMISLIISILTILIFI